MKTSVGLLALILISCASSPRGHEPVIADGRILSERPVPLWIGHNFSDLPLYEFQHEGHREGPIGLIEAQVGQCPYNSRPGEQLFRVEYSAHGILVDTDSDHARLPTRLITRYFLSKCELIPENGSNAAPVG